MNSMQSTSVPRSDAVAEFLGGGWQILLVLAATCMHRVSSGSKYGPATQDRIRPTWRKPGVCMEKQRMRRKTGSQVCRGQRTWIKRDFGRGHDVIPIRGLCSSRTHDCGPTILDIGCSSQPCPFRQVRRNINRCRIP